MVTVAGHRRAGLAWFVGVASGVYLAALAAIGQLPYAGARASAVGIALTIDLVVVVPLAYFLLVLRPRRLPIVTLVPVLALSGLAASRILPGDQQQALRVFELAAVPLELGLLAWIGWRAARIIRKSRRPSGLDPIERLRQAAFEVTGSDRVAAILASEIAVFRYAIGSWRARPHVPAGTRALTLHRRGGHGSMVVGFVLVISCEAVAVHLLLAPWSALAAWLLTIGSAYAALWLVADYRATVLRPILIGPRHVLLRAGLRCTLEVPRERIVAVGRTRPEFGKESVDLTFLGTPTRWLTLSEPMSAEGPYGMRRRVRAIGIAPDAPEEFDAVAWTGLGRARS